MTTATSITRSARNLNQLSYANPLDAVFLRTLAWEYHIAGRALTLGQVVKDQVRLARLDLGLPALGERDKSGAADDYVQQLRKRNLLSAKGSVPTLTDRAWETEWRMLHLPSHSQVRQLSYGPVLKQPITASTGLPYTFLTIALRDPAMPMLDVWIGPDTSIQTAAAKRRGAYVLRLDDSLYLGKSDEFETRLRQHNKTRTPKWCVFCSPTDESSFTLDSLGAAESLLISYWNEVCRLDNRNQGSDRRPAPAFLQQAILFTAAFSATLIWLVRDRASLVPEGLTFKTFRNKAWPTCYLDSGR